jgi:hypothetical protein
VQVILVGYSKGSLSTRQYLKSLTTQIQDPRLASAPPARIIGRSRSSSPLRRRTTVSPLKPPPSHRGFRSGRCTTASGRTCR